MINKQHFDEYFPGVARHTSVVLKIYSGEEISPLEMLMSTFSTTDNNKTATFCCQDPALFGLQWLGKIKLDWTSIKHITVMKHTGSMQEQLDALKLEYKEVFEGGLGEIKGPKTKRHLKEGATPKFHKARRVPNSLRPK